MSPAKAGNPAPKSETELLKDQLQRLKQQMVSSNAAQDEEMSSLRQVGCHDSAHLHCYVLACGLR